MGNPYTNDDFDIAEEIEIPLFESIEDIPEDFPDFLSKRESSHRRNHEITTQFLGEEPRAVESYSVDYYYACLLAWAVKKCVSESPGWKTISIHGYSLPNPIYKDVQTDYTEYESCLVNGQILLQKKDIPIVVTISAGRIQIDAREHHREEVNGVIREIRDFINEHNFYRGKKISLGCSKISFLEVGQRRWDSIILDPDIKNSIRLNSIGFLQNYVRLQEFGIPAKRGIILAGDPGTGKTMACKALMSEAETITCIATEAYGLLSGEYFSSLYSIAQDLSPSMVFIEDIDFVGQERHGSYRGTPAFLALLAEMDGIQDRTAIVTVATSNCVESLDKALLERPSRFDCIYQLNRPTCEQRIELVNHISQHIPLTEDVKAYVAERTNGCTLAQVERVVHGMAISHIAKNDETMHCTRSDVDHALTPIINKRSGAIGFKPDPYH